MEVWHYWIVAGITLLILEILTPGFVLASFGIACFGAAVFSLLSIGLSFQVLAFCIISLIVFIFIRPVFTKYLYESDSKRETGAKLLIGKTGKVIQKIQGLDNPGRVKVEGEDWRALSETGENIDENEVVVINKIEGVTMFVKRIIKER